MRTFVAVGCGSLGLLAHLALVYLLMRSGQVPGAMITGGLGALVLAGVIGFILKRGELVAVLLLCGFVGSMWGAYQLDAMADLAERMRDPAVARDVAPRAIAAQPRGRLTFLSDASVDRARVGGAERTLRRGGLEKSRVAPLIPPGWTPTDPVPAWAAFETNPSTFGGFSEDDGLNRWAQPSRAGWVREPTTALRAAIADAERRFALRSAPDAPLFHWFDPAAEHRARRDSALKAILIAHVIWLVFAIGSVRRAPRPTPART